MAQSFITFFLDNNVAIIQIGFAIIFVLVVFVILRSFKEDKESSAPVARSISERRNEMESLEDKKVEAPAKAEAAPEEESSPLDDLDNLDDLMGVAPEISQDQIDQTLSEVTDDGPQDDIPPPPDFEAAAGNTNVESQVEEGQSEELTTALKEKEKVIADLRAEIKTLQGQKDNGSDEEAKALKEKVEELTDKLAEYEIIEDDIANLSFYKSENIKLKNELEKLRGTNAALAEAEVEAEAKNEAKPEKTAEAAPPEESKEEPEEDVLTEFQEAVKQKDALEQSVVASETEKPADDPITKNGPPNEADLLSEFESAVEAEIAAPESAPEPTEPVKASEPVAQKEQESGSDSVDSSKLVEEVEQLASTEVPKVEDDGKDNNEKLIEEFENFLNKT